MAKKWQSARRPVAGVTEHFDVLLSDLHMPLAGDGFTVVSAMRHTHPKALTMVLSGYPALDEAMAAIVSQADEIITKPFEERPTVVNRRLHSLTRPGKGF
jgi:DNA-binding NtrC family response regulator